MTDSILVLSIGMPGASARGLSEALTPISQATALARTINADMVNLAPEQFRKYGVVITGGDQRPPAFDGLYVGKEVDVACITELSYKTVGGTPSRPVVSGSSHTEGDFTFYRPQLSMVVTAFNSTTDEYGALVNWTLSLEEK